MRTFSTIASITLAGCMLASFAGCASTTKPAGATAPKSQATTTASAGMMVNSKCPIMPDHPIDPAVTVNYKSQKVGFCCAGCIDEWDKLSESKKNEMLAKAK